MVILATVSFGVVRIGMQTPAAVVTAVLPAPTSSTTPEPVRLLFVGDMMLGRNVEKLLSQNGERYLFSGTREVFRGVDAVIANLEAPIVYNHTLTPAGGMRFSFASSTAKLLAKNGVGIVSRSNNHGLDQGARGWADTSQLLQRAGVEYFGSPTQLNADVSVATTTINGKQFVFIGMNTTHPTFVASAGEKLVRTIASSSHAFVVVSIHWGDEYILEPNAFQKSYARKLIDDGADLIVGHHPHVVQSVDVYRGVPIFYSLGNFIFDQYFSDETQEGLAIVAEFGEEKNATYTLVPLMSKKSRVSLMSESVKTEWLKILAQRSPDISELVEKGEVAIVR